MRERHQPPRAFVVGHEYGGPEEVAVGLHWLVSSASAESQALVIAPQLSQYSRGSLVDVVGEQAARVLGRGQRVSVMGRMVLGATWRNFPPSGWNRGPVLALWPDSKALERIERARASAICVVPASYETEEIAVWATARRATDLLDPDAARGAPVIRDPVVAAALSSLTMVVNLGTGLGHPSDRGRAIETFRLLRGGGHSWSPDEVQAWAMANGWDMHGASEVREVAEGVLEGKRYRTDAISSIPKTALEAWRAKAAANDG